MLQQHKNNVEAMWQVFKRELETKVHQYVPIAKNFNFRNKSWTCALDIKTRNKISDKHRLWRKYMKSRDPIVLKQYKTVRNAVCKDIKKT